jgi:hypothetical protein
MTAICAFQPKTRVTSGRTPAIWSPIQSGIKLGSSLLVALENLKSGEESPSSSSDTFMTQNRTLAAKLRLAAKIGEQASTFRNRDANCLFCLSFWPAHQERAGKQAGRATRAG